MKSPIARMSERLAAWLLPASGRRRLPPASSEPKAASDERCCGTGPRSSAASDQPVLARPYFLAHEARQRERKRRARRLYICPHLYGPTAGGRL